MRLADKPSARSKMSLPPLTPQSLLFGHANPSSSCSPFLPQLQAVVLLLLLLPATACLYRSAPINGWLLCPSLLHLLPALLSSAPIIDTFFASCRAILFSICVVLFSICAVLFLIAHLPPSKVIPLFAPPNKIRAGLTHSPGLSCFFCKQHQPTSPSIPPSLSPSLQPPLSKPPPSPHHNFPPVCCGERRKDKGGGA